MDAHDVSRSPLRWAGSKRKLLPTLQRLTPVKFQRYVEPFCGSLCLYVALKPASALVGDINEELMNFYRMVAWRPKAIASAAHRLPDDEATYYELRRSDPHLLSLQDRAVRFLYLNRFCFNGVYRTNRQGAFNVARGKHMGSIPPVPELVGFGRLMRRATIHQCDFEELVNATRSRDFIYVDPPYAGRGVRDRGEYGLGAFKEADLDRLAEALNRASERGVKVLLSYADLPEIRRRFRSWNKTTIDVTRNVAGFASARGSVSELILRNYES
ncbi:DNA adenine methylase [Achromobacter xylosoxidans]|uniref:DNA adenine methylase n=1 Tax=Alcaligenes xylosoxydans xylosoxydans TaxID=85698 RepID=UPI000D1BC790|nr:Dam family site-specific DNA-(adenine-N6)-methyltransferase [Achromobacter xylosoxidans]